MRGVRGRELLNGGRDWVRVRAVETQERRKFWGPNAVAIAIQLGILVAVVFAVKLYKDPELRAYTTCHYLRGDCVDNRYSRANGHIFPDANGVITLNGARWRIVPDPVTPTPEPGVTVQTHSEVRQQARDAIASGRSRDAVINRVRQLGVDPSGI